MNNKVLVAYASKYGSTQEVAEVIATMLRGSGSEVDIQPMRKVRALTEYSAVVLGAPIYLGHWHKDAMKFLAQHQESLTAKPTAIFVLGPFRNDEPELQASRSGLETELAQFPWLKPAALEVFVGKYDPAKLNLPDRLITSLPASPLHGLPASDQRDWAAIRTWAGSLAAQLQPALSD